MTSLSLFGSRSAGLTARAVASIVYGIVVLSVAGEEVCDELSALQVGRIDQHQQEATGTVALRNTLKGLRGELWEAKDKLPESSEDLLLMISVMDNMTNALSGHDEGTGVEKWSAASASESYFMQRSTQRFQIDCMKKPGILGAALHFFRLVEGMMQTDSAYPWRLRKHFGNNFVTGGQLVESDRENIKKMLTSPQHRTQMLGSLVLNKKRLPAVDIGQREVLPITISQDGPWEAFRPAFDEYLFSPETVARQKDAVANKLLDIVAQDYKRLPHGRKPNTFERSFFWGEEGLQPFLIRYLHYVIFGLDPTDDETMAKLMEFHFGLPHKGSGAPSESSQQYIQAPGPGKSSSLMQEVQRIYERSPALKNFKSTRKNWHMTKAEISRGAIALMGIAGLQGTKHAIRTAMGWNYIKFEGLKNFDTTKVWDKLDLENRTALRSYAMECVRICVPVTSSHLVAQEKVKVKFADAPPYDEVTFPKGTQVSIPISIGNVDEEVWGPTALQFDAAREGLDKHLMSFNSWGTESAGRMCPGRELTLTLVVDMLAKVGAVRRGV